MVRVFDKFIFQMRLGKQLMLLCGALLVLTIGTLTTLNITSQREELDSVFRKQAQALAFNAGVSVAQPLLESNFAEIEEILLKLEQFDGLKQATVTEPNGNVIARVTRGYSDIAEWQAEYDIERVFISRDDHALTEKTRFLISDIEISIIEPIRAGNIIGYTILDFDLSNFRQREQALLNRNMGVALILVVASILVLYLFLSSPTRQLGLLTNFATRLVKNQGETDHNRYTSHELNTLNSVMNTVSTELAQTYHRLEQSTIRADKANELKSQFLANMSHEIRTPLNGILGMCEVSLNRNMDEGLREEITLVQNSAENLLRVVNDILDFSKIEANRLEIDPHPFAIRQTVHAVTAPLRQRYVKPGVEFVVEIGDDVPDYLEGDAGRIAQVLNNLLSNALKFTEKGAVKLSIDLVNVIPGPKGEKDQAKLAFVCQDTGIGIPKDMQSSIFDSFTQAESSTTRKFGGTGLGLSIIRQLLALMHSKIRLDSTYGVGSTFSFEMTLPIIEEVVAQDHASDTPQTLQQGESLMLATRGAQVLVAEDNGVNQKVISHVLAKLGVAVTIVENGQLAVQACHNHDYDVIFMDLQMPVMGGLEATEQLIKAKPYLKVIGLTADALSDTREACLASGMKDFLTKPFKAIQIEETLRKFGVPFATIDLKLFDGKTDVLKNKAKSFVESFPQHLANTERAISSKDYESLATSLKALQADIQAFGDIALGNTIGQVVDQLDNKIEVSTITLGFLKRNLLIGADRIRMLSGV